MRVRLPSSSQLGVAEANKMGEVPTACVNMGGTSEAAAGEVAAVLDWELTTLGDPRLDLAWLLITSGGVGSFETATDGFPTTDELVVRYGEKTGLPLDDLTWWQTLACYKLGIILEGTNARAAAGRAPVETGRDLPQRAVLLFEQAGYLIEGVDR